MSIRRVVKTYHVPQTILRDRIKRRISKIENRNVQHNLILIKEEIFVRYILNLDL